MALSVFLPPFLSGGAGSFSSLTVTGNTTTGGTTSSARFLGGDGSAGSPTFSYTSELTLGFFRSAAGTTTHQGALTATGTFNAPNIQAAATGAYLWAGRGRMASSSDGVVTLTNSANSLGSSLKTDALPTIASGFGGTPAVIAGSTALAGAVNVGTGGAATTGVINWNGAAFPSAPFVVVTCSAGAVPTVAVATTTTLTLTTSVAWPASTIVNWHAISSK